MSRLVSLLSRHDTPLLMSGVVVIVIAVGSFSSQATQTNLTSMLISLIVVIGLYMFVGNSGVFSFGHIGFMAIGAYTAAILTIPAETKAALFPSLPNIELGSVFAVLAGGMGAALIGFMIALPLMRLSGLVASLGTFAFLNITFNVASSLGPITGGSTGLAGVPRTATIGSTLVWAILAILLAWAFQRTRVCLRLRGARDDEDAARAVGIGVTVERTVAFVASAFVTGVGGALFSQAFGTFNPSAFFIGTTFVTVAMLVVGGRLSLSGAVIGTLLLSLLGLALRAIEKGPSIGPISIPEMRGLQQVGIAVTMLLILLLRPRGLTGGREIGAESLKRGAQMLRARLARMFVPKETFETGRGLRQKLPQHVRHGEPAEAEIPSGPPVAAPAESPSGGSEVQDGEPSDNRVKLLSVVDLTVHYGNVAAVQGLSIAIEQGEIVAMVGANGAGKSTTLKTLSGFLPAIAGSVVFDGESILGETPERIVRRGIALVPEGRQVLGTLTVGENLQLGCTPRTDDRADIQRSLEEVIVQFPMLGTYYRSSAGKLSGGEQQQLAIARALLSKPRLLLLDEPSLGLSPMMIEAVFDVLAGLREAGVTVLLIEQNAYAALDIADRAYVLRSGRLVMQGTRAELLAEPDFAAAYLGDGD